MPNSLILKSGLSIGWFANLRANAAVLPSGWVLIAGASSLVVLAPGARRPWILLFAPVALSHLLLARTGWLFRYEAYLLAWGALAVVVESLTWARRQPTLRSSGAEKWRERAVWSCCLVALGLPLLARSYEATSASARNVKRTWLNQVQFGQWLARHWNGAVVASLDLGAPGYYSDATIVDLAGIGTNQIARLWLVGPPWGPELDRIVTERGTQIAFVDYRLPATDLPPASLLAGDVQFEIPGAERSWFQFYAVDPSAYARLRETLLDARTEMPGEIRIVLPDDIVLPLAEARLSGSAVHYEENRIGMYSSGSATFTLPASGRLWLALWGTQADGRYPKVALRIAGEEVMRVDTGPAPETIAVPPGLAGETLEVVFWDDLVDADGNDRNLWLHNVILTPDAR